MKATAKNVVKTTPDEERQEQLLLIPEAPPNCELRQMPLGDLQTDFIGPKPTPELLVSVKRWGLLQPVILTPDPAHMWRVIDGQRRIQAAREAGFVQVPAIIMPPRTSAAVARAMVHATRKANPATEYTAIQELLQRGAHVHDIAVATGLHLGQINARLRLQKLHGDLFNALADGRLKPSVAALATRMPTAAQERLAARLKENGRLKVSDVKEAKLALRQAAIAAMPASMFHSPEDVDARPEWVRLLENNGQTLQVLAGRIGACQSVPDVVVKKLDMLLLDARMLAKLAAHAHAGAK